MLLKLMMALLVVVAAFVVLTVCLKLQEWVRGDLTSLDHLDDAVDYEMRGGSDGTCLRIERCDGQLGSVEFVKRIKGVTPSCFFMLINESDCAAGEFESIQRFFDDSGFDYAVQSEGTHSRLFIDFGRNTETAVRACRSVFSHVWRLPPDTRVRVRRKGPGALLLRDKDGKIKWQ